MVPTTKGGIHECDDRIDPHKASHTAVAIGRDEDQIAPLRCGPRSARSTSSWAGRKPFEKRTWAIESVGGLGYLLAQQLVARGEDVLDVPATLASRTPGAGHEAIQQERSRTMPTRSPLPPFGHGGFGWSSRPITPKSFASSPSAIGTWAASELG